MRQGQSRRSWGLGWKWWVATAHRWCAHVCPLSLRSEEGAKAAKVPNKFPGPCYGIRIWPYLAHGRRMLRWWQRLMPSWPGAWQSVWPPLALAHPILPPAYWMRSRTSAPWLPSQGWSLAQGSDTVTWPWPVESFGDILIESWSGKESCALVMHVWFRRLGLSKGRVLRAVVLQTGRYSVRSHVGTFWNGTLLAQILRAGSDKYILRSTCALECEGERPPMQPLPIIISIFIIYVYLYPISSKNYTLNWRPKFIHQMSGP